MTLDEVIYQLKSIRENSETFIEKDEPDSVWAKDVEALDEAIMTLLISGRLEARKVKREKTLVGHFRCPNCNAAFIEGMGKTDYCGNCGQRLDWDE